MRKLMALWLLIVLMGIPGSFAAAEGRDLPVEAIRLPEGFQIEVYAADVPNARQMALGEQGTLFAGSRQEGKVYAIYDRDKDGTAEEVQVIAEGLSMPSGIAFHDGDLYAAAIDRVIRFEDIETKLPEVPEPVVVSDAFPDETHHGWKFIAFGPDEKLYVPVGAPCNICKSEDEIFASIMRMNPDGSGLEIFASGIRNTVGFDWHPETGGLWFTENGRDWLGDDLPPDELNHAPRAGMHFGYPHCHGKNILDPEFGFAGACEQYTPAAQELGPHVAALGMRFYDGEMFPEEYRNQIFIAEHGSWNRSTKIGYRIMLVRLNGEGQPVSYEPFAEGWKQEGGDVWGRPADVLVMPDGALLVADDHAGAIYRISYRE